MSEANKKQAKDFSDNCPNSSNILFNFFYFIIRGVACSLPCTTILAIKRLLCVRGES